jgi:serine/threonine-protein kinase BUR1
MVTSPAKRPASASPDAPRLSKRPATSSPEEGELDDPSPPLQLPSSLPAKPQPASAKPKVPFPFKKKGEPPVNGSSGGTELNESDGRFSRDGDARRRPGRGPGRPSMVADHWEPPARYYAPQRWDSYPLRDYRDDRDRARERGRSPPPPPSYSPRSRSASGSPREKHRLPAHRPQARDVSPSPLRVRDRDRERDARHSDREDRERDRDRRYREDNDDRHYHPDDFDRHGRRDYSHRRVDDRRGGRRESDYDYDRSFRYDDRNRGRRNNDSYRPSPPRYAPVSPFPLHSSPQTQPPPSTLPTSSPPPFPPPPRSPSLQLTETTQIAGTPPPPAQSPPPAPPPDDRLLPKNDMLPESHTHVAIPMKRPGAPKDIHSPPSILHHESQPADKDKEREKGELKVRPVWTREVVRRSRKEEMEAYGRTFRGCGEQSEYEVTTKLGEGTFGCVHLTNALTPF